MKSYIIFNKNTGEVRNKYSGKEPELQGGENFGFIESSEDIEKVMVLKGKEVIRPDMPVSLVGETLIGIPKGATFSVRKNFEQISSPLSALPTSLGEIGTVDDGILDLKESESGTYTVELRLFPYLPYSTEVIVL
jgi:hypothetical protein